MTLKGQSRYRPTRTWLVDAVIDGYVAWREESATVSASYESWRSAPREARAAAFEAYRAALDREEHAASQYQRLLEQASS